MWLRLTGAGYWRFYLPFGHVNFFGPKDEYFLSRDWPEAVPPAAAGAPPRRCYVLDPPPDLKQPVLRAAGARVTMTPTELDTFNNWSGTDADLNDWFFGRHGREGRGAGSVDRRSTTNRSSPPTSRRTAPTGASSAGRAASRRASRSRR